MAHSSCRNVVWGFCEADCCKSDLANKERLVRGPSVLISLVQWIFVENFSIAGFECLGAINTKISATIQLISDCEALFVCEAENDRATCALNFMHFAVVDLAGIRKGMDLYFLLTPNAFVGRFWVLLHLGSHWTRRQTSALRVDGGADANVPLPELARFVQCMPYGWIYCSPVFGARPSWFARFEQQQGSGSPDADNQPSSFRYCLLCFVVT